MWCVGGVLGLAGLPVICLRRMSSCLAACQHWHQQQQQQLLRKLAVAGFCQLLLFTDGRAANESCENCVFGAGSSSWGDGDGRLA
jgi:hypothetical protein